jgi:hypothetical protein
LAKNKHLFSSHEDDVKEEPKTFIFLFDVFLFFVDKFVARGKERRGEKET